MNYLVAVEKQGRRVARVEVVDAPTREAAANEVRVDEGQVAYVAPLDACMRFEGDDSPEPG